MCACIKFENTQDNKKKLFCIFQAILDIYMSMCVLCVHEAHVCFMQYVKITFFLWFGSHNYSWHFHSFTVILDLWWRHISTSKLKICARAYGLYKMLNIQENMPILNPRLGYSFQCLLTPSFHFIFRKLKTCIDISCIISADRTLWCHMAIWMSNS